MKKFEEIDVDTALAIFIIVFYTSNLLLIVIKICLTIF